MNYLHIRGTLGENMVYRPRRGYESSRRASGGQGDPAFQLVLLDTEGRVLLSATPQVIPRGCGTADDPLRFSVRGSLPLHPDGAAYELRRGEIRLYQTDIPSEPPKIAAPRCYTTECGPTLEWQAAQSSDGLHGSDSEAAAYGSRKGYGRPGFTYAIVAIMETGRRITLARGLTQCSHTVDLSRVPVHGKGTLYLAAHDGVRSAEVKAMSLDVPVRPPTVHILVPRPGTPLPFGQPLSVLGCCLDMGGQPCSADRIVWLLDGERRATGSLVAAFEDVRAGAHRLTLAYEEDGTYIVESSIELDVEGSDANYVYWEELMAAGSSPNRQST
jgi:hypothetical protein